MTTLGSRPANNRGPNKLHGASEDGKNLWSTLLDGAATSKRLPQKTLLVLGGTVETQKNFVEALSGELSAKRRPAGRTGTRKQIIANQFALGYTYQDILDVDQDDILARLSEPLLLDPHPAFTQLLRPLFTTSSIPDMALTILLDWSEPWNWLRQIRAWVRAVRGVLSTAGDDVEDALKHNTRDWLERKRGPKAEVVTGHDYEMALPIQLGPGEWDEALGIPICVVCQNAEKIEVLEREHGWKEYHFDTVLVYLRTILLKHGGALIYTASAAPGFLQPLLRSILDIHSILQRSSLQHNVNDRDKVLVPPNWDSWGKIRPLREDFDFEAVSKGWSADVDVSSSQSGAEFPAETGESAVISYEALIRDPTASASRNDMAIRDTSDGIEVECESNQDFLARQLQALDKFKAEDEVAAKRAKGLRDAKRPSLIGREGDVGRVSDHIGSVQFNVGGIQIDAEQIAQDLKDREAAKSPTPTRQQTSPFLASPDSKSENEALRSFFANLASKGGSSASSSPRAVAR